MKILNIQCLKQFQLQTDIMVYGLIIDDEINRNIIMFKVDNLDGKTLAKGLREMADKLDKD